MTRYKVMIVWKFQRTSISLELLRAGCVWRGNGDTKRRDQAPLSMGFSKQNYWSWLPFLSLFPFIVLF